mgnify:CR=1 FL=1
MKKYLLTLIALVCAVTGAWADDTYNFGTGNGSSATIDGTTITINVNNAGEFATWVASLGDGTTPTLATVQACTNVTFTGTLDATDLAKFDQFTASPVDFDLTGISLVSGTSISSTVLYSAASSYFIKLPATIPVTNNFLNNSYNLVAISVNGTTTKAYIRYNSVTGGSNGTLAKIPAGTETIVLYTGGENNLGSYGTAGNPVIADSDLHNLYPANFVNCNPTTLDLSNVTAWTAADFGTNFTNYQAVSGETTTNAERWANVVDPSNRLSVTGTIDATRMEYIRKNFKCESIDLSGATLDPDASILQVNSTLRTLTLPAGTTITDAIKSSLSAQCPDLLYVYSPTNTAQTATDQTVPDYVFVVNGGGLHQGIINESKLCKSAYIKVESYNPLLAEDVTFGYYDAWDHAFHDYAYLDFSGANVTPDIMKDFTYANTNEQPDHRIILPDNWSYDDMAKVASGKGLKLVALYSYDGTRLNILGLSFSYSSTALADSRIVRSGTTAVDFVQGTYNNTTYGMFTSSMLDAINNANTPASIKNASVSVSNVNFAMTFSNTNLTVIDLEGVNASNNVLNVDACSSLTYLNLGGATVGNVDASVASMQSVNLLGTTINGYADFSNATSLQRITVDTKITGALTATGCTNLMRISNTGTIGSIAANGSTGDGNTLTRLSTFINSGTVGDVNLSYTGLSNVTNTGTVDNFTATNCSSLTALSMAGTVNGDINLTDCDNLASLNVANATINNQGTSTGDIILTRSSATNPSSISDDAYSNIKDKITKADSGQASLVIVPGFTAKEEAKQDVSVAGVTAEDCALTVTIGDTGKTMTQLLKEYYHLLHSNVAVADVTVATHLSTLSICNLTVNGEITADDIMTINGLTFGADNSAGVIWHDATLNLDGATLASGVSLSANKIANATINNIILPQDLDKTVVKAENFSGCTNLNAAVSLDADRTTMVGYVKKPGTLRTTLDQVPDIRINPWQYNCNLKYVTLSGSLLASDIATSSVNLNNNGNYELSANGNAIYTAFENDSKLATLDIENAKFVDARDNSLTHAANMTLANLGWAGITELKMSLQMDTIPANFLYNCKQINNLKIPYCYRWIKDAAFHLSGLNHITTTDANGAEIDNGENTYTLSKNLLEIGTNPGNDENGFPKSPDYPVFGAYNSGTVSDVYILRNGYEDGSTFTPTKCYRGTFASGMTYGWGGFDGGNIYCRDKYKNGSFLFTILHYPDKASLPTASNTDANYVTMEKSYTDITKQYTKKDQTGAVDANGDAIPWPTFAELGRSYNQAIRRLIWADWTPIYGENPDGNILGGTINFDPTTLPDGVQNASPQTRFDLEYVGWHEFVLSKATYVAPDEKVEDEVVIREYEQDGWYTFCIPFDMTRAQVLELMGIPASTKTVTNKLIDNNTVTVVPDDMMPDIRTLKQVTRNGTNSQVTLILSKNLNGGEYWNIDLSDASQSAYANNSNGVVIRGGYPYLIKPYKRITDGFTNLGRVVLARYEFPLDQSTVETGSATSDTYIEIGGQYTGETSKFAKPFTKHKIQASNASEGGSGYLDYDSSHKYYYTFMGQYWRQALPLYSYYMVSHVWYFYKTLQSNYYWNPYKCIINVNTDYNTETNVTNYTNESTIPEEVAKDEKGHAVFKDALQLVYGNGNDDSFTTSGKEYIFMFDDGITELDSDGNQTTAISRLDNEDVIITTGKVYNMSGQFVGNSIEGLPHGLYIRNGKKVVVK